MHVATALSMAAMAFLITIVLGYPYLSYLRRAGLGKKVRIEGPRTPHREDGHADHGRPAGDGGRAGADGRA